MHSVDHCLDAQQFWRQFYLGFVPILAAFRTTRLPFDLGFLFGFALLLLSLGRRFLGFAADDLFHPNGVGAPLRHIDQSKCKDRNAGHHFAQQPREKVIQTIGLLAGFRDQTAGR